MSRRVIYKYPLPSYGQQTILMPMGSRILTVQTQKGVPHMWALVDLYTQTLETKTIIIYGTGHTIDEENIDYINTFQVDDGDLIYHVFEKKFK